MSLPRSVGFDTLSGRPPPFPDYSATECMFIDWELIKRGLVRSLRPRLLCRRWNFLWCGCHTLSGNINARVETWARLLAFLSSQARSALSAACRRGVFLSNKLNAGGKTKWCQLLTSPGGGRGRLRLVVCVFASCCLFVLQPPCLHVAVSLSSVDYFIVASVLFIVSLLMTQRRGGDFIFNHLIGVEHRQQNSWCHEAVVLSLPPSLWTECFLLARF